LISVRAFVQHGEALGSIPAPREAKKKKRKKERKKERKKNSTTAKKDYIHTCLKQQRKNLQLNVFF
jgi:methionine synthase II (cobalamin-independent)